MELTDHHLIQVQAVLDTIPLENPVKFRDLTAAWTVFAVNVGRGWHEHLDEYIEDLSPRLIIQMVIDQVDADLADYLSSHLHIVDTMFLEATTPVAKCLVSKEGHSKDIDVMLYYRVPKKRTEQFSEELRECGIL